MARIRTIKPAFFRHEGLYDLEQETGLPVRLAFAGLWTCADREGRFEWRPRVLKLDCLPHDAIDFSRVLDALLTRGFILRYEVGNAAYGCIPTWSEHQVVNNRETASDIPACPQVIVDQWKLTRGARVEHASPTRHDPALGEQEGEREQEQEQEDTSLRDVSAAAPADAPIPDDVDEPEPETPPPASKAITTKDIEQAVEAYNAAAALAGWSRCDKMHDQRRKKLRARLIEWGGLEGWIKLLERAAPSKFMRGLNRDGWKAHFDFFLQPSSLIKLSEGLYDNRDTPRHPDDLGGRSMFTKPVLPGGGTVGKKTVLDDEEVYG